MAIELQNFAKTYDTTCGQVLVLVDEDSDGLPGICLAALTRQDISVKLRIGGWENTEQGWRKAGNAFGMFDAEAAENFVTKILPGLVPDAEQVQS